jgi:hypothetical protein
MRSNRRRTVATDARAPRDVTIACRLRWTDGNALSLKALRLSACWIKLTFAVVRPARACAYPAFGQSWARRTGRAQCSKMNIRQQIERTRVTCRKQHPIFEPPGHARNRPSIRFIRQSLAAPCRHIRRVAGRQACATPRHAYGRTREPHDVVAKPLGRCGPIQEATVRSQ